MDKRNANDVCSIGKLMEPEMQTEPLATSLSSTAQQKTMKMKSLATPPVAATPHSPTAAASAALLQLETVGNGNHDKFAMRTGKSAGEVPHSISLTRTHALSVSLSLSHCLLAIFNSLFIRHFRLCIFNWNRACHQHKPSHNPSTLRSTFLLLLLP